MASKLFLVFSVLGIVSFANAASAPFITKCKSSDLECAKASASKALPIFAAGVPDLGIEVFDPMIFEKVDSSSQNLKFLLTDITVKGLSKCQVQKLERDASKINIQFLCTASLDGNYDLEGQVLVLSVKGKDKVHVTLRDVELNVELEIADKTGSDGKKHWNVKRLHHTFTLKNKADVVFENLFKGNDALAQAAKELFIKSGTDIIQELGAPMIKEVVLRVGKSVKNLFASVPVDELSID